MPLKCVIRFGCVFGSRSPAVSIAPQDIPEASCLPAPTNPARSEPHMWALFGPASFTRLCDFETHLSFCVLLPCLFLSSPVLREADVSPDGRRGLLTASAIPKEASCSHLGVDTRFVSWVNIKGWDGWVAGLRRFLSFVFFLIGGVFNSNEAQLINFYDYFMLSVF